MANNDSYFAFLVPHFNDPAGLEQTLASIEALNIDSKRFCAIVSDNQSDDGTYQQVRALASKYRYVELHRTERNVGKIGNWQVLADLVSQRSVRFYTFLMCGDVVTSREALMNAIDLLEQTSGVVAFTPTRKVAIDGSGVRDLGLLRRMLNTETRHLVINGRRLAEHALRHGALVFAPLQGNVYRNIATPLQFDSRYPYYADQLAVVRLLRSSESPVVVAQEPYFGWNTKQTRGTFKMFAASSPVPELVAILETCEREDGDSINWAFVSVLVLLQIARWRFAFSSRPARSDVVYLFRRLRPRSVLFFVSIVLSKLRNGIPIDLRHLEMTSDAAGTSAGH